MCVCFCSGNDSGATRVSDTLTGYGGFGYHTITVIPAGLEYVISIAEAIAISYVYLDKLLYILLHYINMLLSDVFVLLPHFKFKTS